MTSMRARERTTRVTAWLATLFYFAFIGLVLLLVVVLWLPDETVLSIIDDLDPEALDHRVHEFAISVLGWGLLIGVAAQIHEPARKVAAMQQALAIPLVVLVFDLITGIFSWADTLPLLVPVLIVSAVHCARGSLTRVSGLDASMSVLASVAAVPWLVFAVSQTRLQITAAAGDAHAEMGHWAWMASFAVVLVVWAFIGASNNPGWRVTAWTVAVASLLYASHAMAFPDMASATPVSWSLAIIVWSVLYLVAAERRARRPEPAPAPAYGGGSVGQTGSDT